MKKLKVTTIIILCAALTACSSIGKPLANGIEIATTVPVMYLPYYTIKAHKDCLLNKKGVDVRRLSGEFEFKYSIANHLPVLTSASFVFKNLLGGRVASDLNVCKEILFQKTPGYFRSIKVPVSNYWDHFSGTPLIATGKVYPANQIEVHSKDNTTHIESASFSGL